MILGLLGDLDGDAAGDALGDFRHAAVRVGETERCVERALARAGELELMVHTEVSNLERSYADNERRMRTLIDELASEREAIVANADRVRQSVTNAQETISREVVEAGARIAAGLVSATASASTAWWR